MKNKYAALEKEYLDMAPPQLWLQKHGTLPKNLCSHVLLEDTGFLPGGVVFQLEKSRPLDKRRLRERAGRLTAGQMERIDTALRSYFYLEDGDYLPLEIEAP